MEYFKHMTHFGTFSTVGEMEMEALETPNSIGTSMPMAPQTENAGRGQTVASEGDSSLSKEQQEKVDRWMKEVKAFIRKIDIDSL